MFEYVSGANFFGPSTPAVLPQCSRSTTAVPPQYYHSTTTILPQYSRNRRYVSGANFFGEILEWTGFAIAGWRCVIPGLNGVGIQ